MLRRFHEATAQDDRTWWDGGAVDPTREFLHVDDMAVGASTPRELAHEVWLETPSRCRRTLTSAWVLWHYPRAGANHRQSGGYKGRVAFHASKRMTPRKLLDVTRRGSAWLVSRNLTGSGACQHLPVVP
ncbi:hypothetical protein ACNKHT_13305 [Shigella flexneri]